ncbi:MAG: hypothetical protein ACYDEW_03415, partial [Vulcanimicrobiaceae bacterium]
RMKGCAAKGQMTSFEVPMSTSNWKIRRRVPEKVRSRTSWSGKGIGSPSPLGAGCPRAARAAPDQKEEQPAYAELLGTE